MAPDLASELAAARQVFIDKMPDSAWWLLGAGLDQPMPAYTKTRAFQRVGLLGIVIGDDGRFAPAAAETPERAETWADGALAIIVPVVDEWEELIDLIALRRAKEGSWQWWRRTGFAEILGAPALGWAAHFERPLRVHPEPQHWLAAQGDGAVVLAATAEAETMIRRCGSLEIDAGEKDFATAFYRWLHRPLKRTHPDILLRRPGGEEAAAS